MPSPASSHHRTPVPRFEELLDDLRVLYISQATMLEKLRNENQSLHGLLVHGSLANGELMEEPADDVSLEASETVDVLVPCSGDDKSTSRLGISAMPTSSLSGSSQPSPPTTGIDSFVGRWVNVTGEFTAGMIVITGDKWGIIEDFEGVDVSGFLPEHLRIKDAKLNSSETLMIDENKECFKISLCDCDELKVLDVDRQVQFTLRRTIIEEEWQVPKLWPEWLGEHSVKQHTIARGKLMYLDELTGQTGHATWLMTLKPDSMARLAWDMCSTVVVTSDVISIPLVVFYPDFLSSSGDYSSFHVDGMVELRLNYVVMHYLHGWFTVDFIVLLLDWVFLSMDPSNSSAGFFRVNKSFRLIRILRGLRIVRFVRIHTVILDLLGLIRSKNLKAALNVSLAFMFIIVMTHYFACGWFLVGKYGMQQNEPNWIENNAIQGRTIPYQWATSLHWSLSQFTPASMEVRPYNFAERLYCICVLLAAIAIFSSFLSTITSSITQVRASTNALSAQNALLRRYLHRNNISEELSSTVLHFLRHSHFSKKRMHYMDIAVLELLPLNIRTALRQEVFGPYATRIPFFRHAATQCDKILGDVCNSVIYEKNSTIREELFFTDQVADNAYFLILGKMDYKHEMWFLEKQIGNGQWISEAALWLKWKHCGSLVSSTTCELLVVGGAAFRKLMPTYNHLMPLAKCYAHRFALLLTSLGTMGRTDILDSEPLDDLIAALDSSSLC